MEFTLLTKVFLAFLCLKGLVEAYLDKRNVKHIVKNMNEVPPKFSDKITLEDHQKAAKYSIEKINTAGFFNIIGYLILLVWTLGGGIDKLNEVVKGFGLSDLMTGVVFIIAFSIIGSILSLPASK